MNTTLLFSVLAIYIIIMVFIGRKTGRGETKEGFLIADRNVGFWRMVLSRAAGIVGIGTFITIGGFGYQYGWSVFSYVLGAVIGYLLFAWRGVPRLLEGAKEKKFYTLGDLVNSRLNNKLAKKITDSVIVLIGLLRGLVQLVGGAKIISYFGGMEYGFALLITGVIIGIYLVIGGFKAVLATDKIQLMILLFLGVLVGWISRSNAHVVSGMTTLENLGPLLVVGFFLYGIFEPYANSMVYQLCYASKNTKIAQKSIALAWIPNVIIATSVIAMGIAVNAHFKGIDPDLAFLIGMQEFLNPALVSLAVIMLFAGMMSSLDSLVYATSSHFGFLIHKRDDPKIVKFMQGYIVIMILIIMGAGLIWRDIIAISILVAAVSAGLLPIAMISLLKKNPTKEKFFGSLIGSTIGLLLGLTIMGIDPKIFVVILLLSGLGLFIGSLFSRKKKPLGV